MFDRIVQTLPKAVRLIRKDPLVLAPYVIYFFILVPIDMKFGTVLDQDTTAVLYLGQMVLIRRLLELVFKAGTVSMATHLLTHSRVDLVALKRHLGKRLGTLLIGAGLLVLPTTALFFTLTGDRSIHDMQSPILFVSVLVILIVSFILEYFTVVVMTGNARVWDSIKQSASFLMNNFPIIFMFTGYLFLIEVIFVAASHLFNQIPVLGTGLLGVIPLGLGSCLTYLMTLVFYLGLRKKATSPDHEIELSA